MTNKLPKKSFGARYDAGLCCTLRLMSALLLGLITLPLLKAQTFSALYNFTGGSDGGQPYAGVIQDPAGNVYGTTTSGGDLNCGFQNSGCGVLYKLDTADTETVLHIFSGSDGAGPDTPLVRDKAGNIYGTTYDGGTGGDYGYGTVFKIDTAGNEAVLYYFAGGSDGCYPEQGLVVSKSGIVFGTTTLCGSSGSGTIFKVDSAGNFTVLHTFAGYPSDGALPINGHLTMDQSGNLYGVTSGGGSIDCRHDGFGCGVLYKLSKSGTLTLLHSFKGGAKDGCYPYGSVAQDKAGNLYGTTGYCGSHNDGIIWEVSKKGNEAILHQFEGIGSDGCNPYAGVARDSKGNLYGVTTLCGANNYGALYEFSAKGSLTLLHSFDYTDGYHPNGEVLRTRKGALFGTTLVGGIGTCSGYGCGIVWSYVP